MAMDLNENTNEAIEVGDANENFHDELMKFEEDTEEQNDDTEDKKEE
jgi:hypothetical protein